MKKITQEWLKKILDKGKDDTIERKVSSIIEEVRKKGDKALIQLTERFDGVKDVEIKVPEAEIVKARRGIDRKLLQVIEVVRKRIEKYHRKQMPERWTVREKGLSISFEFSPVETVGIYIPAAQSPLVSTVLMAVVPAYVAGVKEVFVASPPSFKGSVHPVITGVLGYLGVENIFAIGGAQAIAAFAYGTETVPRVDVIAGPGNKYVNTAKILVSGHVGIDTPAGPSELVIFSDGSGRPEFIAADMNAQIEHRNGLGILITTSEKLGGIVSKKVKGGYWLYVKTKEEAVRAINEITPEHLQLMCKSPERMIKKVIAGAVFIGDYSPATLGDYFAGPSHILPTGKTARFSSGLSVYTFLRSYSVISGSQHFYKKYGQLMEILPEIEGLAFHKASLNIRRKGKG